MLVDFVIQVVVSVGILVSDVGYFVVEIVVSISMFQVVDIFILFVEVVVGVVVVIFYGQVYIMEVFDGIGLFEVQVVIGEVMQVGYVIVEVFDVFGIIVLVEILVVMVVVQLYFYFLIVIDD